MRDKRDEMTSDHRGGGESRADKKAGNANFFSQLCASPHTSFCAARWLASCLLVFGLLKCNVASGELTFTTAIFWSMRRQDCAISMAVSCLSPVRTQICSKGEKTWRAMKTKDRHAFRCILQRASLSPTASPPLRLKSIPPSSASSSPCRP